MKNILIVLIFVLMPGFIQGMDAPAAVPTYTFIGVPVAASEEITAEQAIAAKEPVEIRRDLINTYVPGLARIFGGISGTEARNTITFSGQKGSVVDGIMLENLKAYLEKAEPLFQSWKKENDRTLKAINDRQQDDKENITDLARRLEQDAEIAEYRKENIAVHEQFRIALAQTLSTIELINHNILELYKELDVWNANFEILTGMARYISQHLDFSDPNFRATLRLLSNRCQLLILLNSSLTIENWESAMQWLAEFSEKKELMERHSSPGYYNYDLADTIRLFDNFALTLSQFIANNFLTLINLTNFETLLMAPQAPVGYGTSFSDMVKNQLIEKYKDTFKVDLPLVVVGNHEFRKLTDTLFAVIENTKITIVDSESAEIKEVFIVPANQDANSWDVLKVGSDYFAYEFNGDRLFGIHKKTKTVYPIKLPYLKQIDTVYPLDDRTFCVHQSNSLLLVDKITFELRLKVSFKSIASFFPFTKDLILIDGDPDVCIWDWKQNKIIRKFEYAYLAEKMGKDNANLHLLNSKKEDDENFIMNVEEKQSTPDSSCTCNYNFIRVNIPTSHVEIIATFDAHQMLPLNDYGIANNWLICAIPKIINRQMYEEIMLIDLSKKNPAKEYPAYVPKMIDSLLLHHLDIIMSAPVLVNDISSAEVTAMPRAAIAESSAQIIKQFCYQAATVSELIRYLKKYFTKKEAQIAPAELSLPSELKSRTPSSPEPRPLKREKHEEEIQEFQEEIMQEPEEFNIEDIEFEPAPKKIKREFNE